MSALFDQDAEIPTDEELFPTHPGFRVVELSDYRDPPPAEPTVDPVECLLWWTVAALGTLCFLGAVVMFATTIFR